MLSEIVKNHSKISSEQIDKLRVEQYSSRESTEQKIVQKVRDVIFNEDYKIIESKIKNSPDFRENVKVTEVQDALKKLTESFQLKLDNQYELIQKLNQSKSSVDDPTVQVVYQKLWSSYLKKEF